MTMKLYRKTEWMRALLEGGALVSLRKPTTPEWVDAVAQTPRIDAVVLATIQAVRGRLVGPVDLRIPGAEIEALATWFARWTLDLTGIEAEDEAIAWVSLDEASRAALWAEVGIGDLTHLYSCIKMGMRGGDSLELGRKVALMQHGLDLSKPAQDTPAADDGHGFVMPPVKKKSRTKKKGRRG